MYKLEFTLKQHTPIIHFQHEQDGATLRATEVKPKLDRFILMKLGKEADTNLVKCNEIYEKGKSIAKDNGWLIDDKKGSLDYKLRIIYQGTKEPTSLNLRINPDEVNPKKKFISDKYPLILANMVGKPTKSELKDFIKFDTLDSIILTSLKKLNDELNNNIIQFFANTNFGNRNNKGFGSFTIIKVNNQHISFDENNFAPGTFYLEIPTSNIRKVFESIDFFYKWLKSGINYSYVRNDRINPCKSGRYKKAVLFEYLQSILPTTGIGENWEKKWIKENFLSLPPKTPPNYNSKYFRALLGLSDKHTFTKAQCCTNPEFVSTSQRTLRNKIELQNLHSTHSIDRITSPFTFKIIIYNNSTKAYILINEDLIDLIYSSGLGLSFTFFQENEFQLNYRIGAATYDIDFKYPKNDLSELDVHLNRIRPHTGIPALNDKYNSIKEFKNQFKVIDLPNSKINYMNLLSFFKTRYSRFIAKDFNWIDITPIQNIELKTV